MEELLRTILTKVNSEIEAQVSEYIATQINDVLDNAINSLQNLKFVPPSKPVVIDPPQSKSKKEIVLIDEKSTCAYCGKQVDELYSNTYFCSKECLSAKYPRKELPEKKCEQCDKVFSPWTKDTKFCSIQCVGMSHRVERPIPTLLDLINCGNCQKEFIPRNLASKYCSDECRQNVRRQYKTKWSQGRYKELRARGLPSSEIEKSLKIPDRECTYCGKPSKKLYCSEECRKKHETEIKSGTENIVSKTKRIYQQTSNEQVKTLSEKYPPIPVKQNTNTYSNQLEAFQKRMAKRGIRIPNTDTFGRDKTL